MPRILILSNNDVGLYKFRKELIEQLVKQYEVFISLPYGDLVPELEEIGCTFIDTPISRRGTNPITDLKLLYRYIKIIKKYSPDIVLTYTIKPNVYGGIACRLNNIPYIENVTGLGSATENKGFLQKVTLTLYRLGLKKANCVFFQNKENQSFFKEKKIVQDNYKLIPGSGVNTNYFSIQPYPRDDIIHFIFIARIMKEKGIEQYLDAAIFIRDKYPYTRFHILGFCEEGYRNKLIELQKKGIIQYHGMQHDVRKYLKTSHCTIHPTFYPEGMSNVLLESAASGRPIITTNRSGCKEIVDNDVNGYVVEQKNSNDLIDKIESFLKLSYYEKKNMGLASRQKIEKEFDRNIVIEAYLSEIQNEIG